MRMRRWTSVLAAALALGLVGLMAGTAAAKKKRHVYPGPYRAEVLKVVDSDTLRVAVDVWPGLVAPANVRLFGVDTPEKFRPKCPQEKELALRATTFVKELVAPGDTVWITQVQFGKYAGRVVGKVFVSNADGERVNLGQLLIDRGFAKPYFGGHKSSWCKEDKQDARD